MISASDVIATGYYQRARRWHWAAMWATVAGIVAVLCFAQGWPMLAAVLLAMAAHRQSNRNMDRAQAVLAERITSLRAELRAMGIDPDE